MIFIKRILMARDPAFLFYPGDWIGGTMYFTFEQKGAYFELLMLQFHAGEFTEIQAKQVLNSHFETLWPTLRQKFKTDGTLFWNQRLMDEVTKRRAFSESRRNNRIKGIENKTEINKPVSYDTSYEQHMENENTNTNTDIIIKSTNPNTDLWNKFEKWIKGNAPRVQKLKEPLTMDKYFSLRKFFIQEFNNEKRGVEVLADLLVKMHNWAPLLKKNIDANLTVRNWYEMHKSDYHNNKQQKKAVSADIELKPRRTANFDSHG